MSGVDSGVRTRVVFTIPSMGLGGSERVLLNLLRWLNPDLFELHLAVLHANGEHMADLPAHVEVHLLGVSRARYASPSIASIVRRTKADILFSTSAHLNSAAVLAKALLFKPKVRVFTREGADIASRLRVHRQSGSAMSARCRLAIYRRVYRQADVVVCQSEAMRREMVRDFGVMPGRAVRMYNPVDIDQIKQASTLARTPFARGAQNVVVVSRLSYEKGIDLLLPAFHKVLQSMPQLRLTLVGSGPAEDVLRRQVSAMRMADSVEFAGAQRNPYPFMSNAQLLVLPSRSEAFPNVVLESVSLGVPVVASPCSNALREISECSSLVRVARSGVPQDLALEIVQSLAVDRSILPPSEEFIARFGIRNVVNEYERLFRSADDDTAAVHQQRAAA